MVEWEGCVMEWEGCVMVEWEGCDDGVRGMCV